MDNNCYRIIINTNITDKAKPYFSFYISKFCIFISPDISGSWVDISQRRE